MENLLLISFHFGHPVFWFYMCVHTITNAILTLRTNLACSFDHPNRFLTFLKKKKKHVWNSGAGWELDREKVSRIGIYSLCRLKNWSSGLTISGQNKFILENVESSAADYLQQWYVPLPQNSSFWFFLKISSSSSPNRPTTIVKTSRPVLVQGLVVGPRLLIANPKWHFLSSMPPSKN